MLMRGVHVLDPLEGLQLSLVGAATQLTPLSREFLQEWRLHHGTSFRPRGSYPTPFLGYLALWLGSTILKSRRPKRGVGYSRL